MKKSADYLKLEQIKMKKLTSAFCVTTASGMITYFIPSHGIWQQFSFLLHTVAGIYLTIIFLPYIYNHFRRTSGLRRPTLLLSGILTALVITWLFISGIQISLNGQQESLRWIYQSHVASAFISISFLLLHLLIHRAMLAGRRKNSPESNFMSVPPRTATTTAIALVSAVALIALSTLLYAALPSNSTDEAAHTPYQYRYGSHPFRPSQTETLSDGFIDARRVAGSEKCGSCHREITAQWKSSMHSQAASDQAYQTNIQLLAKSKGIAATRYCEGCHAPVALLSGELTEGGRLDTPGHMLEGVGCLGCHGIDRIEHVKGVGSYRFSPRQYYLFAEFDNVIATKISNFLIRIQPRQHRIDMARDVIASPKLCATCHAQFMDKDMNNWGWVKMQDEYSAWLNSPYSLQSEQTFSTQEQKDCQDCHMPLERINDPSATSTGLAVSHLSLGANTAIPWYTGDKTHLTKTIEFLQSNKVRISIEIPNRLNATRSKNFIDSSMSLNKEAPAYYYLGETVSIKVIVSNVGVGHDFPGGTTDINEVWINFSVVDTQNNIVYVTGAISNNNDVDPNAHFYRSIAIDRKGAHVWKHDLFNMVGDSYKKIIPAGKSDIVEYNFTIPSWVKGPLTLSAVVKYRKFNNRYARWALDDSTIQLPIVDMARTAISIPVRIRKEVETK